MRSVYELTFLGLDVHKDTISVGVLEPGAETAVVDKIPSDGPSVRRLISRFPDRSRLRACYEAGPTGFALHRLLTSLGVACDVVAPSLIPKAPGDKVKTDKRGCRRLARLHRAGELTAISVRFASAPAFMGFTGLVPSEYSSGLSQHRGHLTKTGNAHLRTQLVESAWAYQHRPNVGSRLKQSQAGVPPPRLPGPGPRSSGCVPASGA